MAAIMAEIGVVISESALSAIDGRLHRTGPAAANTANERRPEIPESLAENELYHAGDEESRGIY